MSIEIREDTSTAERVAALRAAVSGAPSSISRTRAIAAYSRVVRPEVQPDLMRVAADATEPAHIRALAATALARLPLPPGAVMPDLVNLARSPTPPVACAAIKALGRLGDKATLDVLVQIQTLGNPVIRERSRFAAALIAHRLRLPGHELSPVSTQSFVAAQPPARPIVIAPASLGRVSQMMTTIVDAGPGLKPSGSAWEVVCLRRYWMLVLDNDLVADWSGELFATHSTYAGQLASRNPTTDAYGHGLTILTTPDRQGGFDVGMYRDNGTVVLAGSGRPQGDNVSLTVRSVARPGAWRVIVTLTLHPRRLDIAVAESGPVAIRPRRPSPA